MLDGKITRNVIDNAKRKERRRDFLRDDNLFLEGFCRLGLLLILPADPPRPDSEENKLRSKKSRLCAD